MSPPGRGTGERESSRRAPPRPGGECHPLLPARGSVPPQPRPADADLPPPHPAAGDLTLGRGAARLGEDHHHSRLPGLRDHPRAPRQPHVEGKDHPRPHPQDVRKDPHPGLHQEERTGPLPVLLRSVKIDPGPGQPRDGNIVRPGRPYLSGRKQDWT